MKEVKCEYLKCKNSSGKCKSQNHVFKVIASGTNKIREHLKVCNPAHVDDSYPEEEDEDEPEDAPAPAPADAGPPELLEKRGITAPLKIGCFGLVFSVFELCVVSAGLA